IREWEQGRTESAWLYWLLYGAVFRHVDRVHNYPQVAATALEWLLDYGLPQEEATRDGQPEQAKRFRFDDASLVVSIDGGPPIQVENPKAYLLFKTVANASPRIITAHGIREKVAGLHGDKGIPRTRDELPEPLKSSLKSDTRGYWLRLPPPGEMSAV